MLNLSKKFKKSFSDYLKDPTDPKNKKRLIDSAFLIYEDAVNNCGIYPDEYIPYIHGIIKSALSEQKINVDTAHKLDALIRELSFSDLKEEIQAFHTLNIAYNLTHPKKSCLREISTNFLTLQEKLDKEYTTILNKNHIGSMFINNSDVINLKAKKSVIDNLINSFSEGIFNKSNYEGKKFFPISYNVKQKIQYIEQHIDSLSEKQCEQILVNLIQNITLILNVQENFDDIKDNAEYMTDSGKRSALMIHSFNNQWFFTFLSKMVKVIKEALGIKTSAEKLLENAITETKNSGISFKFT